MGFLRSTLNLLSGKKEGTITKQWMFSAQSEILSPPLTFFHEEKLRIAFGTKKGLFYLLDENVHPIWTFCAGCTKDKVQSLFLDEETASGIFSTPVFSEEHGLLLFGSEDSYLYALDMKGVMRWKFKTKGPVRSQPLIADNKIFFGSTDKTLYILDFEGTKIGSFTARSGIEASPVLYHSKLLFGSDDGTMYCIEQSGINVWEFKTEGKITARALITDLQNNGENQVIFGSSDRYLYVIDTDGKELWKYETEGPITADVKVADVNNDHKLEIVFGCSDDKVYCLSYNGNKIWDFEADFWVVDSPHIVDIDSDGKLEVVVGSLDSTLYVLDAQGSFSLNYMPGISSIAQQSGHYSDVISGDVGEFSSKKLWEVKADGMVIGTDFIEKGRFFVVGTKNGMIEKYVYTR